MIDLRSDTVTLPTPAMREAMADAPLGDDVYGEDPSVNALEQQAATLLGMQAALFAPSGTQTNLLALLAHCERGDEYIVGQTAHTYKYEGGGAAVLGSIQPQPLDFEPDGTLDLARVRDAVKADDFHFARTRLLCLENTQAGKVLPMAYLAAAADFTRETGLALHLDGARLFNAAVALDVAPADVAGHFDSVSICLSKGLGAPVGSLLCGSAGLVARARRWRKMLGGGMRQAGMLAAAGSYALHHHVARLADDHANAHRLAAGLAQSAGVEVDPQAVQTNMVHVRFPAERFDALRGWLAKRDIRIAGGNPNRMVTHLDIDADGVDRVVEAIREFLRAR